MFGNTPSATISNRIGTHAVHSNDDTSWMCASANSGFGTPNATFCNIQSR